MLDGRLYGVYIVAQQQCPLVDRPAHHLRELGRRLQTVSALIAQLFRSRQLLSDKLSKFNICEQLSLRPREQKITLEGLKFPTYNNCPTSKVQFGSFWPIFPVIGPFQALDLAQSLKFCQVHKCEW